MIRLPSQHYLYGKHLLSDLGPLVLPKVLWWTQDDQACLLAKEQSWPCQRIRNVSELSSDLRMDLERHGHVLWVELCPPAWKPLEFSTVLLLDHLTDVQNLGAILRSACTFGVEAIFYPKHGQAALSPRVRFIAQGAAERVPCFAVPNINQQIKKLKDMGFWVYGCTEQGSVSLPKTDWAMRTALVIGAEDHGMRKQTQASCDVLLKIPYHASFSCLNAAMAASIVCYQKFVSTEV